MPFSSPNSTAQPAAFRSQSDNALLDNDLHLLEQTFGLLPDIVSIYDVDVQQVIYSNRSFATVLGYEDESFAYDWLLHPDDAAAMDLHFQQTLTLQDAHSSDVSFRLKHANGTWRWFSERQVIFKRHGDGRVAQILKTARYDKETHTDRPHILQDNLLRYITEYNLPNFAFLLFDHDLRYTVATGILLRRMGFLPGEMEGRTLREVAPPDTADWLEPAYQAALAGAEIHLEHVTGGIIVSVHCLPVRNEHGEITAGMVLAEDVTDEKQATAALVESEQRFAQFSENMQSLFWMLDTDRRKLLYVSPAFSKIWEISPKAAYENPVTLFDMVHPDDRQMVSDTFEQTFSNGSHEIKFRIIPPSGTLRWLTSRAFPIYDDSGSLYRVAGIADDITEQMGMEKATFDLVLEREHMRLLTEVISNFSHEVRTPLAVMNTSLYLIKKTKDPAKQAERLQLIERQVGQLARTVEQMSMLLRVENLPGSHALTPVSLNTMLGKIEVEYAPVIAKKELALEMALGDNLPSIDTDPDLLLVALQNLFDNAINYTDTGSIKAQTAIHENEVILTVQDSGIGITDEDQPHIFERFYKVETNKRREVTAAGLGLTIVKRIMELSGGRIEAESQLGQGSSFRLIWPVKS